MTCSETWVWGPHTVADAHTPAVSAHKSLGGGKTVVRRCSQLYCSIRLLAVDSAQGQVLTEETLYKPRKGPNFQNNSTGVSLVLSAVRL